MGVLVGVGDPGLDIQPRVRHDDHPLLDVVVEPEHLVAEQLELQLGDILVGLQQAERAQGDVVALALLRRVLLVEQLLELHRQLVPGDDVRGSDLGRFEAADADDLLLDLVEDRLDLRIARRRGFRGCRGARLGRDRGARVCRGAGDGTKADAGAGDVEPQDRDARDHDDGHEDQDQAVGCGHRRHSTQPGGTGLNVQVS